MMKRLLSRWVAGGGGIGGCRLASSSSPDSMLAWQIDAYNSGLSMNKVRVPRIDSPTDMLVEVKAASVNPIDVRMSEGYGNAIVGVMRQIGQRSLNPVSPFPLTLGRDCSGVVREVGRGVQRFRPGDEGYKLLGGLADYPN
uniref:Alcohol dehydrogenase-like N-terminal domain-containing protein n=1 Tax=Plectus sambesii TaxID=2011161 RepID=A0A914X0C4_9BILA